MFGLWEWRSEVVLVWFVGWCGLDRVRVKVAGGSGRSQHVGLALFHGDGRGACASRSKCAACLTWETTQPRKASMETRQCLSSAARTYLRLATCVVWCGAASVYAWVPNGRTRELCVPTDQSPPHLVLVQSPGPRCPWGRSQSRPRGSRRASWAPRGRGAPWTAPCWSRPWSGSARARGGGGGVVC